MNSKAFSPVPKSIKKALNIALLVSFLTSQAVYAAPIKPLEFAPLLNNAFISSYNAPSFRFLSVNPLNPQNYFNFLLDKGDGRLAIFNLNHEAKELYNYFLIGLSLPNDNFWVNLNPKEPDRIISSSLAKTDMGKIMLSADLELKKAASRIIHPNHSKGKLFWNSLYKQVGQAKDIDFENRIWIVPNEAQLWQTKDGVMIVKSSLKVMLENEFNGEHKRAIDTERKRSDSQVIVDKLLNEIILPELTREVNTSKTFAQLRQVYNSLILAQWYKTYVKSQAQNPKFKIGSNNQIQNSNQYPIDQGISSNIQSKTPWSSQDIYQDYMKSYQQSEFKVEQGDTSSVYTSGGEAFNAIVSSPASMEGLPTTERFITAFGDKAIDVVAASPAAGEIPSTKSQIPNAAASPASVGTLNEVLAQIASKPNGVAEKLSRPALNVALGEVKSLWLAALDRFKGDNESVIRINSIASDTTKGILEVLTNALVREMDGIDPTDTERAIGILGDLYNGPDAKSEKIGPVNRAKIEIAYRRNIVRIQEYPQVQGLLEEVRAISVEVNLESITAARNRLRGLTKKLYDLVSLISRYIERDIVPTTKQAEAKIRAAEEQLKIAQEGDKGPVGQGQGAPGSPAVAVALTALKNEHFLPWYKVNGPGIKTPGLHTYAPQLTLRELKELQGSFFGLDLTDIYNMLPKQLTAPSRGSEHIETIASTEVEDLLVKNILVQRAEAELAKLIEGLANLNEGVVIAIRQAYDDLQAGYISPLLAASQVLRALSTLQVTDMPLDIQRRPLADGADVESFMIDVKRDPRLTGILFEMGNAVQKAILDQIRGWASLQYQLKIAKPARSQRDLREKIRSAFSNMPSDIKDYLYHSRTVKERKFYFGVQERISRGAASPAKMPTADEVREAVAYVTDLFAKGRDTLQINPAQGTVSLVDSKTHIPTEIFDKESKEIGPKLSIIASWAHSNGITTAVIALNPTVGKGNMQRLLNDILKVSKPAAGSPATDTTLKEPNNIQALSQALDEARSIVLSEAPNQRDPEQRGSLLRQAKESLGDIKEKAGRIITETKIDPDTDNSERPTIEYVRVEAAKKIWEGAIRLISIIDARLAQLEEARGQPPAASPAVLSIQSTDEKLRKAHDDLLRIAQGDSIDWNELERLDHAFVFISEEYQDIFAQEGGLEKEKKLALGRIAIADALQKIAEKIIAEGNPQRPTISDLRKLLEEKNMMNLELAAASPAGKQRKEAKKEEIERLEREKYTLIRFYIGSIETDLDVLDHDQMSKSEKALERKLLEQLEKHQKRLQEVNDRLAVLQGNERAGSPVAGIDLKQINPNVTENLMEQLSANPVDDKIMRAAEMLKRNWNAVAVLYLQEAMLLLKYNIVKEFGQRDLAVMLLGMLKDKGQLDEGSLNFYEVLQAGRPIEELKLALNNI